MFSFMAFWTERNQFFWTDQKMLHYVIYYWFPILIYGIEMVHLDKEFLPLGLTLFSQTNLAAIMVPFDRRLTFTGSEPEFPEG